MKKTAKIIPFKTRLPSNLPEQRPVVESNTDNTAALVLFFFTVFIVCLVTLFWAFAI